MMDVVRTGVVEAKRRRRWLLAGAGVVVLALVTVALANIDPAAPGVDRDTVWLSLIHI